MNFVELLTQREFLISVLAAISAAAVVFTFGSSFIVKSEMKDRIKRVALEREKMRAEEMARLRGGGAIADSRGIRRSAETKTYMKNVVERFDLKKAFQDDATVDKLWIAQNGTIEEFDEDLDTYQRLLTSNSNGKGKKGAAQAGSILSRLLRIGNY